MIGHRLDSPDTRPAAALAPLPLLLLYTDGLMSVVLSFPMDLFDSVRIIIVYPTQARLCPCHLANVDHIRPEVTAIISL